MLAGSFHILRLRNEEMSQANFLFCCSWTCSGIDFEGGTVGLAFVGTMCTGHSVGVVQVSRASPSTLQKISLLEHWVI